MYIWTNKLSSRSTLYLLPGLSLPSTLQKLCSSLIIICKSIQNLLTVCYLTQISNTCTTVYLNCFDVWSHNLFKTEPGLLSDCSLSVRQMSSWILWLQILVTRRAITHRLFLLHPKYLESLFLIFSPRTITCILINYF